MDFQEIKLDFLGHSGFIITAQNGMRIAIDPFNISAGIAPADIILITHSHYDHCSIKDITTLSRKGTTIVVPGDAQSKITRVDGVQMHVIEVGEEATVGNIKIETIPAYNIEKDFHPKKEGWFGYLIKIGKTIVYHAGDTDNIPEMQKLTGYGKEGNYFVALLPVSGTYVMNPEEAAEAAFLIKPALAIPMHYGAGVAGTNEDAEHFVKLCEEKGISAKKLEKI
jgi:L-ascorbate metabolism protein UlaG (beta-lactamase superfamily)